MFNYFEKIAIMGRFMSFNRSWKWVIIGCILWNYASFSVLVLREVRENSWNLSKFSLLLGKQSYKNPRRFLYRFEHANFVLILKCSTILCRIVREILFQNVMTCAQCGELCIVDICNISKNIWPKSNMFFYRSNQTNFIHKLKLKTAPMRSSQKKCRYTPCMNCHIVHRSWQANCLKKRLRGLYTWSHKVWCRHRCAVSRE